MTSPELYHEVGPPLLRAVPSCSLSCSHGTRGESLLAGGQLVMVLPRRSTAACSGTPGSPGPTAASAGTPLLHVLSWGGASA